MPLFHTLPKARVGVKIAVLVTLMAVAGCTVPDPEVARAGVFDPYERQNRKVHAFNKGLDRSLVRPAGKGYTTLVPAEIQNAVGNFSDNLAGPSLVTNNLLQGNMKGAAINTYRFVINTVLGFGGLVDVADEFGIAEVDTDFGETLHVWGAPEGAYVELPALGPSTERDAAGKVVDLFTNPLSYVLPSPEKHLGTLATVTSKVGDRGRYADTVDSILYDSADSYAQARLIYLQNRRFELGGDGEDAYADPYNDPYDDPYEDPYAE